MNDLAKKYGDIANFLVIYISEAHPMDYWPLGKHVQIAQHKTVEDRIEAAKFYTKNFGLELPIVIDTMDNDFDKVYASWPERFYIIKSGQIEHIGTPSEEDNGFDKSELESWLAMYAFSLNSEMTVYQPIA